MTPAQFAAALTTVFSIPPGISDERTFLSHYEQIASEYPHDAIRAKAFKLIRDNHENTFFPSIAECKKWLNRAHISPEYRAAIPPQDYKRLAAGERDVPAIEHQADRTQERRARVDKMVKDAVHDIEQRAAAVAPERLRPVNTSSEAMGRPRANLMTDQIRRVAG